jgi:transmembrane sensor
MKQESAAPLSNSARAEAAAWVARLHSSSRSPALEAGLRKWLKSDSAHIRAFEVATEAWEIGGSIKSRALPRMADPFVETPRRTHVGTRYLGLAAGVLVALVGTLFYLQQQTPPIATAVGEQRMLTLTDGTRIFLNTDTRLFVQEGAAQRRIKLESGEALFDVAKDPQRPFVVTAGDKEVIAIGTSFVVRRDERQLTVTLMEGKVAVSPSAGARPESDENPDKYPADKTVLAPGQRLTFVSHKPPKVDEPPIEKVTAWRRGEVILDKTRLQDAVDEMNRYSAVRLVIDDAAADILVSGIFRAGDSARFAQAVAETYHLAVDHEPRRIRISTSQH